MFEALALLVYNVRSPMFGISWVSKVFAAEARYLGPYLHTDNTYNKELERRIKNTNIVFDMWRRFCIADGTPIKIKTQLFKGIDIQTIFQLLSRSHSLLKITAELNQSCARRFELCSVDAHAFATKVVSLRHL